MGLLAVPIHSCLCSGCQLVRMAHPVDPLNAMRIVRTRSIPNVDDERLLHDLARLHEAFHTPEGLARHDGSRRELFNNGIKGKKIAAELVRRGHVSPACRFCAPHPLPFAG